MFYALPQAPQMFKQLLMVSGFDKYFQIAPCFRDEAARADRSPGEFYQMDIEMSYATQDEIFAVVEDVVGKTFKKFSTWDCGEAPWPRIKYRDAMMTYGSDKPDLRNPLKWINMSDFFAKADFKAFAACVQNGGLVKGLLVKGIVGVETRTWFDKREAFVKENGGKGLGYISWTKEGELKGPIAKFLSAEQLEEMKALVKMEPGDALFFMAADVDECNRLSGLVRTDIADHMTNDIREKNCYRFCWIVDFPFFEKDPETGKIIFSHNPFSMPQGGLEALETKNPLEIEAYQYDVVCNGIELSSGAIRNHRIDIMYKAFEMAGYTKDDVAAGKIGDLGAKVQKAGASAVAEKLGIGAPTLKDIVSELEKPGRDIRDTLPPPVLRDDILSLEDLKPDMELTGTVRNVIDFGAFVDIGVHQDGLVHISQISNRFVKHPSEVVKVGDIVKVRVLSVDVPKKRISLTMKIK
jgi:aspartyl-tRNA synthetase